MKNREGLVLPKGDLVECRGGERPGIQQWKKKAGVRSLGGGGAKKKKHTKNYPKVEQKILPGHEGGQDSRAIGEGNGR